jgi:hypothetical protein
MKRIAWLAGLAGSWALVSAANAHGTAPRTWTHGASPIIVEIVGRDGRAFREFPLTATDGALRSYLQAEKGGRYGVRVRNATGQRLGLVIAVDGRNIINGRKSELARDEPMYVLDAWTTQDYSGWRANLQEINEFYFTDWSDSYAEAFGDRSARGVIAVAVYREVPPPSPLPRPFREKGMGESESGRAQDSQTPPAAGAAEKSARHAPRSESAGTGYGDRQIDHAVEVEFVAVSHPDSRHFIKYEWRETLCRKRVMECAKGPESNRFWDESTLGFAPPPPRYLR